MKRVAMGMAMVLVLASGAWAAAEELAPPGEDVAKVVEIPRVQTLPDLKAQPPIVLADGWRVRVGIGEPGAEAGPWTLVYCYAEHEGNENQRVVAYRGPLRGEFLGPVLVDVTMGTLEVAPPLVEIMQGPALPRRALYCRLVPVPWKGEYRVSIRSRAGGELARTVFKVEEPQPCWWLQFGRLNGVRADYTVEPSPTAAVPALDGWTPVWVEPEAETDSKVPEDVPLPGRVPTDPQWGFYVQPKLESLKEGEVLYGLSLALEEAAIVVRSEVPMITWPDLQLVARWWVNGRPVLPVRSDDVRMIQLGRAVTIGKEMRLDFGLPKTLGSLKAGDTVGLQVLYSPAIIEQLPKTWGGAARMAAVSLETHTARFPLLSNRLEFMVTESMLESREPKEDAK
jgi:hypothetical protein